jgi:predicted nucleic acid-binding protein
MLRGDGMTLIFNGEYAADSSVLIELAFGTPRVSGLRDSVVEEKVVLVTHELAVVELRYILCRRLGQERAWAQVEKLLGSGHIVVEDASGLMGPASLLKCERHIALPDCFTLALANKLGISALFASREVEILREMDKSPFKVEVEFLEE